MKTRRKKQKISLPKELEHINLNAAGIDIGSASHFVAVPVGRDEKVVREFQSFTPDLKELLAWLKKCGITTVVMESTGVYWIPLYEMLEKDGFEVFLVNARHVKNVPGRKSDVLDCQWLQQLHTYGLLRGSFRPTDDICVLRGFMRQREMLVINSASHIQHMQKALTQMNLQLHNVLSDIVGATGLKIIRSIVAGERDPATLAQMRDRRCKNSLEVIQKSLEGNYRKEHVFALTQALELYDFYHSKIADCDCEIETLLTQFSFSKELPTKSLTKPKKKYRRKNELHCDVQEHLYKMIGTDLTRIDGLEANTVLSIISEIGTDMNRWTTVKHFGSWLGLAPGTKISGGKVLSTKTKQCANRAAGKLRLAANTLARSPSALGAFFRRKKAQLGAPKAITATAYKIARIIYAMIKGKKEYQDAGEAYYEQKFHQRIFKNVTRRAKQLGYKLVPETPETC